MANSQEKDMVMKKMIPAGLVRAAKKVLFPVPARLAKHFIQLDPAGLSAVEQSIRSHYHTGWRSEANYSPEMYRADLQAHLIGRLESDRREIVPWLESVAPLANLRILEIGCGTGSSTVALAEQGAKVTGIDIDEGALQVARDRAKAYGVQAEFRALNAEQLNDAYRGVTFDMVIFFACLEHMTHAERLASLAAVWQILPAGGLLVTVETPNRLWYFDGHTAQLPFYHWLPNELAFAYSQFSPRENFRELYRTYEPAAKEHFLRRGRGMSFHEFELAIGPARELNVISSLSQFQGLRYKLRKSRLSRQFKSVLRKIYPHLHQGFFDDYLFLIIRK